MIQIDADALFRAVTATGYKLLAYNLNLDTGEIVSRTLRPDEVQVAPAGPSVPPLPPMGGDLSPKKDASPFGPLPVATKKNLFGDEGQPKKNTFDNDFWKRDEKKKPDLFGDGGFKREHGSKKLAEIFGGPPAKQKPDLFKKAEPKPAPTAPVAPAPAASQAAPASGDDPRKPRIPAVTEEQMLVWMMGFAKDFGDPEIRDEMMAALQSAKPLPAFEKVLRKHQRMSQQWERYFRRQALFFAETWLSDFGISWELIEPEVKP
ncbi:MAG TPA: UPF0158 family protein [Planctomycetota bacterium]|nr:UPF0158 family protein [Planctomycetota bacterium]